MLNSKYFIDNLFNSDKTNFKFEQKFLSETKRIGDYSDFNGILSYLNSFKLFDSKVLREIFKPQNLKKFKIELIQWIFECSEKNFEDLKKKMDKKLKILRLFYQTKKMNEQAEERVNGGLSCEVNWALFDRLVLTFEEILKDVSKEVSTMYKKQRIISEDVIYQVYIVIFRVF